MDRVNPGGRPGRRWFVRASRQGRGIPPLGVLCTQVASRLRSGAGVVEAWQGALGRSAVDGADVDADGVPAPLLAQVGESAAADAVVVACRLAVRCGTPLAEILDECALGVTEVEAADAERRRALAGPATTARLLVWLPVASVLVGTGMGADPLGTVLHGGPAAISLVVGAGFLGLGRWWIRQLVRGAERTGSRWDP
ncbi:type II secretion system F family protein [Serinibacter arcticus]|uniref:type II secretion system F family protein n=1 Tax=Serinibacter arcticus TaxID=1655435 RepID=UPI001304FD1A|nr:hypothetical protein [Serinibacter arcticus]